jgi:hypothetical protein
MKLILGLSVSVALSISASRVKVASHVETTFISFQAVRVPANCAFHSVLKATFGATHDAHHVHHLVGSAFILFLIEYPVTGQYTYSAPAHI